MEWLQNISQEWKILIYASLIILGAAVLSKTLRWLVERSYLSASEKLNVDPTRYKFFKNAIAAVVWFVAIAAIVSLIPKLKTIAVTMFAGAGIFVAILGFAAQEAFSNIINGIFVVIFKPFRVGDLIQVGERYYGTVEDITLRHTVIADFENKRVIIPNATIGKETIKNDNINDNRICKWVEVGVSYDSDLQLAIDILRSVCENHPMCIDARTASDKQKGLPKVVIRVKGFGDSSIDLRAMVWVNDAHKGFQMHSEINQKLKEEYDRQGVEIPFPHRTIYMKTPVEVTQES